MTNSFAPLLSSLLNDLQDPSVLWQVGVALVSLAIAALVSYRVKPRIHVGTGTRYELGLGSVRRLALPLTALVFVLVGRAVLTLVGLNISLLNVAVPLLTAMVIISFIVHLQRLVLPPGNLLATFERTIVWLVWLGFALYVLGLAPEIIDFFDSVSFTLGGHRISLLLIAQAFLWVAIALLLALWIGHVLEDRLMSATGMAMSLRVMLAKLVRALLVVVAGLIVLPVVGIDLTALSVFGGALGVGLGFGLQKVASNYISGFIILLDRSVTIGDVVTIEKNSGKLTKMTARYVVVRAQDGTEAIIPNETVITSAVINQSYTDRKVAITSTVQVSYDSDLELAMRVLCEIAEKNPRVLNEPAPACIIKGFGDNGIDLELAAWVEDPEHGITNLRSEIYLHIWQQFKAHGISIPYPHREVRVFASPAAENGK